MTIELKIDAAALSMSGVIVKYSRQTKDGRRRCRAREGRPIEGVAAETGGTPAGRISNVRFPCHTPARAEVLEVLAAWVGSVDDGADRDAALAELPDGGASDLAGRPGHQVLDNVGCAE
jgi:hypothetical protein